MLYENSLKFFPQKKYKKFTVTNIFIENPKWLHYAVNRFFCFFGKTYWVTFEKWTYFSLSNFQKLVYKLFSGVSNCLNKPRKWMYITRICKCHSPGSPLYRKYCVKKYKKYNMSIHRCIWRMKDADCKHGHGLGGRVHRILTRVFGQDRPLSRRTRRL
jgi:hypothetical protein